jgi:hypothetical protein
VYTASAAGLRNETCCACRPKLRRPNMLRAISFACVTTPTHPSRRLFSRRS